MYPGSTNGLDALEAARPRPEFAPQIAHVLVNASIQRRYLTSERSERKIVPRDDRSGGAQERVEKLELDRSQLDRFTCPKDGASASVERNIAHRNRVAPPCVPLVRWRRAPENRADTSQQFTRIEWLREVVVGPDLEPDDSIDLAPTRGQHENWHPRTCADGAQGVEPVQRRQHDVENHDVEIARRCELRASRTVVDRIDLKPLGREILGDELTELDVVVDDEKPLHPRAIVCERRRMCVKKCQSFMRVYAGALRAVRYRRGNVLRPLSSHRFWRKTVMRRILGPAPAAALAIVVLVAVSGLAQAPNDDTEEVLTNDSITAMSKAGLGAPIIVAKIRSSKTDFDVSSDELIRLKQDGVSDNIIAVMIDSANAPPAPGTRRRIALSRTQPAPRSAWYPVKPSESGIYFLKTIGAEGELVLLEPNVYTQSKETGAWKQALTYGVAKVQYKVVLPGAHARLDIDGRRPTFYFYFDIPSPGLSNAGTVWGPATSANEFVLAKMEVRKTTRELSVGEYGGLTGHNYGVPTKASQEFDYERLEPGIYRVTPKRDLSDGEYCFLYGGSVATSGTGGGPKLFDFAIRGARKP